MFETVAWISIIIGFVVVISFSLAAMLISRRREQNAPKPVDYDEAVMKVDAAADAALDEINKTAGLILSDINEKYQTLLFLYNLIEEKMKVIEEMQPEEMRPGEIAKPVVAASTETRPVTVKPTFIMPRVSAQVDEGEMYEGPLANEAEKPKRKSVSLSARHEKILELFKDGMQPAEIAKELDMGRGEVKLILDLVQVGL